jgi:hypothetical protein
MIAVSFSAWSVTPIVKADEEAAVDVEDAPLVEKKRNVFLRHHDCAVSR